MCYDDGDPPTLFRERWVKARKAHTCCECGQPIPAGVRYELANGLWDGDWGSYKTCERCAAARQLVSDIEKTSGCGFSVPPFTQLAEACGEYDRETYAALHTWAAELGAECPVFKAQVIDAFVRVAPRLIAQAEAAARAAREAEQVRKHSRVATIDEGMVRR